MMSDSDGNRCAVTVRCPLCGSAQSSTWRRRIGVFRQCTCGLVINCGEPREAYDIDYFTGADSNPEHRNFDSRLAERYDAARFQPELDLLGPPPADGRLLDVGSATGSFIVLAQLHGWVALGVEISESARDIAAAKGVRSVPDLAEAEASGPFTVITLHHVVEHLSEPVPVLASLRDALTPGGRLLVEVPNFRSWDRRAAGAEWLDLRPAQHRWQFTPATLCRLLRAAGYRVERLRTLGEPLPTRRSVVQALGLGLPKRSVDDAADAGSREVGFDDYRPGRLVSISAAVVDAAVDLARAGKRLQVIAVADERRQP